MAASCSQMLTNVAGVSSMQLSSCAASGSTNASQRVMMRVGRSKQAPLRLAFQGLRVASPSKASSLSLAEVVGATAGTGGGALNSTMGAKEAGIGIMATKLGMMTYFKENGEAVPVTVVGFHEGNLVTQVKTSETDGYAAVQVGYRRVREVKLTKPEMGHLSKAGTVPLRHLQEFRIPDVSAYSPGQELDFSELFSEGDLVDVSGTSIGKGFAGSIKRHNFSRGPMSHGSKSHRLLGSIGPGTTPGRVYPGKKMPGRMGNEKVKIRKLTIVKVNKEQNHILIKGALPGKTGNLIRITPAKIVGKNI